MACEQYRRTIIREMEEYWGTVADIALAGSQVAQESACRADAQSRFAAGLTQFTPGTAADVLRWHLHELRGCAYPFDARCAIRAMALYDLRLYHASRWAADRRNRQAVMLAKYNGGPGWVERERTEARRRGYSDTHWFGHIELVCWRAAWACRENREYPVLVLDHWRPAFIRAGWQ